MRKLMAIILFLSSSTCFSLDINKFHYYFYDISIFSEKFTPASSGNQINEGVLSYLSLKLVEDHIGFDIYSDTILDSLKMMLSSIPSQIMPNEYYRIIISRNNIVLMTIAAKLIENINANYDYKLEFSFKTSINSAKSYFYKLKNMNIILNDSQYSQYLLNKDLSSIFSTEELLYYAISNQLQHNALDNAILINHSSLQPFHADISKLQLPKDDISNDPHFNLINDIISIFSKSNFSDYYQHSESISNLVRTLEGESIK
jgi:hypothetical protein